MLDDLATATTRGRSLIRKGIVVTMKTDLEILEEQFSALEDQIRQLDQGARKAMKAIEGKTGDFDFDFERYRSLKQKLQGQLPILETKMRTERDKALKEDRTEKERQLRDIQGQLNKTKAIYDQALTILQAAWENHANVEAKAWIIQQALVTNYEALRSNQRALEGLITTITGIDPTDHGPSELSRN